MTILAPHFCTQQTVTLNDTNPSKYLVVWVTACNYIEINGYLMNGMSKIHKTQGKMNHCRCKRTDRQTDRHRHFIHQFCSTIGVPCKGHI